jgi:geranylgeranyl transferase type-2 subunit beta
MSLVSGPGRGGTQAAPGDLALAVDQHVSYIQTLDSVRDSSRKFNT